ncbi:MAG: PadR family transcriptional regulator [Acidobacteria bacterium]|nr:PadR family transcriptional regulator [Acidobacteriota bacterium]
MPSKNQSSELESLELLRGTLDMLIMRALAIQPTHGYGVLRWIERATGDDLRIEEGSLYPALYRLEKRGWIESEWGVSENNRRARFYQLTRTGKAQLAVEVDTFRRFTSAVFRALEVVPDSPAPAVG